MGATIMEGTLYHVHVTALPNTPTPRGWKSTTIVLEGGNRIQQDIMLTKHYCTGKHGVESVSDIINDASMLPWENMIRIKVEQDNNFTLPITPDHYVEVHMLCPIGIEPVGEGWVKSRNPRTLIDGKPVYFYNRRVYNSSLTVEQFKVGLTLEQTNVPYLECKVEQVVYDSYREHDSWWA